MRPGPALSAPFLLALLSVSPGCATRHDPGPTIATLASAPAPEVEDIPLPGSREKAMENYRELLVTGAAGEHRPEAMRRLADLQVESSEADEEAVVSGKTVAAASALSMDENPAYREAASLYEAILKSYPEGTANDKVAYQLARAYDMQGRTVEALEVLGRFVEQYPDSPYLAEAQFRRGEILFVGRRYARAREAYGAVAGRGEGSSFFEPAMYKKGWSEFKLGEYDHALGTFMVLMDRTLGGEDPDLALEALPRADRERLEDTLRAIALSFSYRGGADAVAAWFDRTGRRPYEVVVYTTLGRMYLQSERYTDAAQTWSTFVRHNPYQRSAPLFQVRVVEAYAKGGFPTAVLEAKRDYVTQYAVDSKFWDRYRGEDREQIVTHLKTYLAELAQHHHALAQREKKPGQYRQAAQWYRIFIDSFPDDPRSAGMNLLLADIHLDTGHYADAAREYEHTAYDYGTHKDAAKAGYAALGAWGRALQAPSTGEQIRPTREAFVGSALRFEAAFPAHPEAAPVLARAGEDLFALGQLEAATDAATGLLARHPGARPELRRTAYIVIAHAAFDRQRYAESEVAYQQALALPGGDSGQRAGLGERLAAAIYQQGELARAGGDLNGAAHHYLRVGQLAPDSSIRVNAEYDAAAALIASGSWQEAATVLERFRRDYPKHEFQPEVTRKLALVYEKSGDAVRAANEFERIAGQGGEPEIRRAALLKSAELYAGANAHERETKALERYVETFPRPAEPAIEARNQLAALYRNRGDSGRERYWLAQVVAADRRAGRERSERTRFLAATAAVSLASTQMTAYRAIRLNVPLKKSLKKKRRQMEKALEAYEMAADYGIAPVTTQATYFTAEIYRDLGAALMESQRPRGLNAEELEQYEILLEEQAYPFEEKAIEIHELNLKRAASGAYDQWVEKSVAVLSELMPVRYARAERSEDLVQAIR